MHIEPGVLSASKVVYANIAAVGVVGSLCCFKSVFKSLTIWIKILLAATFFSLFMQIFHVPVGYSELHLIGASVIYFTFGFVPTLIGFALGLLIQGILFEPKDLYHLGVNSLSLIIPLMIAHQLIGKKFVSTAKNSTEKILSFKKIFRFDMTYHAGVVTMVGFWLVLGNESLIFSQWVRFAVLYIPVALLDTILAWSLLKGLNRFSSSSWLRQITQIQYLRLN